MRHFDESYPAIVLTEGFGSGPAVKLDAPLSFWGGIDPRSGVVIDVHHPQQGTRLTGAVVMLPAVRGSNAGGTVLLECIRQGTAPSAVVLQETNQILSIGAIVASELYGISMPIVVLARDIAQGMRNGDHITVVGSRASGQVHVQVSLDR